MSAKTLQYCTVLNKRFTQLLRNAMIPVRHAANLKSSEASPWDFRQAVWYMYVTATPARSPHLSLKVRPTLT